MNVFEKHFITSVSDRRITFIERRFDVILTSLSSLSDENYKRINVYRIIDVGLAAK